MAVISSAEFISVTVKSLCTAACVQKLYWL